MTKGVALVLLCMVFSTRSSQIGSTFLRLQNLDSTFARAQQLGGTYSYSVSHPLVQSISRPASGVTYQIQSSYPFVSQNQIFADPIYGQQIFGQYPGIISQYPIIGQYPGYPTYPSQPPSQVPIQSPIGIGQDPIYGGIFGGGIGGLPVAPPSSELSPTPIQGTPIDDDTVAVDSA